MYKVKWYKNESVCHRKKNKIVESTAACTAPASVAPALGRPSRDGGRGPRDGARAAALRLRGGDGEFCRAQRRAAEQMQQLRALQTRGVGFYTIKPAKNISTPTWPAGWFLHY